MEKGEKTLVKRAMRGNPKAFGTLVEREQEYLYRMAFLYVRQEQDALDVVQESILKAYKSLKTLREPEYFRTWLTKTRDSIVSGIDFTYFLRSFSIASVPFFKTCPMKIRRICPVQCQM